MRAYDFNFAEHVQAKRPLPGNHTKRLIPLIQQQRALKRRHTAHTLPQSDAGGDVNVFRLQAVDACPHPRRWGRRIEFGPEVDGRAFLGGDRRVCYRHPMRWTPERLAQEAGGQIERRSEREIAGVALDSRTVRPGTLFVPVVAARDGHDFAAAALEGGASALLWHRNTEPPPGDCTVVRVPDTMTALTTLASAARGTFKGPVVTISGSNGKTTTRAMISAIVERRFPPTLSTRGNLNNHLGVPLTMLGEPHAPKAMVLELGMSAPGENAHLASITRPSVHVVTSVALEHLEFMKTLEAIAAAEAEPFAFLASDGLAVVPSDEPTLTMHLPRSGAEVWRCGPDQDADVRVVSVRLGSFTEAELSVRGSRPIKVRLRLFGAHNARNAAAAMAVGAFLGCEVAEMADALERVEPVGDRSRTIAFGSHALIADCYNANPGSVAVALESLAMLGAEQPGPKIAVLGDMLELGPQEDELHAAVGRQVAALGLDCVLTFGPRARRIADVAAAAGVEAEATFDIETLARALEARLSGTRGAAVLVKGSRGVQLERLVDRLQANPPESSSGGSGPRHRPPNE